MHSSHHTEGSRPSISDASASLDLAELTRQMIEALNPQPTPSGSPMLQQHWPLLDINPGTGRLAINLDGFIKRLVNDSRFRGKFAAGESTGFLRNPASVPSGLSAKVGGAVFGENFAGFAENIAHLKAGIAERLDELDVTAEQLLNRAPDTAIVQLFNEQRITALLEPQVAQIQGVSMVPSSESIPPAARLARLVGAVEDIQADNWVDHLADSIAQWQGQYDEDFDDLEQEKLRETLRLAATDPRSSVSRFMNVFLEDQALSRVRLTVSMAIMEALAAQCGDTKEPSLQVFCNYVRKVSYLYREYATPSAERNFDIDLWGSLRLRAFSMADELCATHFYACLPVWAEPVTQMSEMRHDPEDGNLSMVREVSYRFRINGKSPLHDGLPIFRARVKEFQSVLAPPSSKSDGHEDDGSATDSRFVQRKAAEAVFLWLVMNPEITPDNLPAAIRKLPSDLAQGRETAVAKMLADLDRFAPVADDLRKAWGKLMINNRLPRALAACESAVQELYLVVSRNVINQHVLSRTRGRSKEIFIQGNETSPEQVLWLQAIKVARHPAEVPGALLSIRVRTQLFESLASAASRASDATAAPLARRRVARILPEAMLNIVWQPIQVQLTATHHSFTPLFDEPRWRLGGPGVDILYSDILRPRPPRRGANKVADDREAESRKEYLAAALTATTIVLQVALHTLIERIAPAAPSRPQVVMVRLQREGARPGSKEYSADDLVYSMAQAVESALMRELPTRMQGLVPTKDSNLPYKLKGTAYALSGGFPLVMEQPRPPAIDRVALIIYATRPCDDSPSPTCTPNYLISAKTYLAEAVQAPFNGYRLAFDRMQTDVVSGLEGLKTPELIVEEVARLSALGYRHVMLLSSHYGARRLGRAARRNSPHTQAAFLETLAEKLPQVCVYPLRRDVFPTVRLHRRNADCSSFEIAALDGIAPMARSKGPAARELTPCYSLATLDVVGQEAERPQSGFCTYFLDIDYQGGSLEWRERNRANMLNDPATRHSLLAVLRQLHYLEAEKLPSEKNRNPNGWVICRPVLDPYSWITPSSTQAAGEVALWGGSRRQGKTYLCLPAVLSRVTAALHRHAPLHEACAVTTGDLISRPLSPSVEGGPIEPVATTDA